MFENLVTISTVISNEYISRQVAYRIINRRIHTKVLILLYALQFNSHVSKFSAVSFARGMAGKESTKMHCLKDYQHFVRMTKFNFSKIIAYALQSPSMRAIPF